VFSASYRNTIFRDEDFFFFYALLFLGFSRPGSCAINGAAIPVQIRLVVVAPSFFTFSRPFFFSQVFFSYHSHVGFNSGGQQAFDFFTPRLEGGPFFFPWLGCGFSSRE